MVHARLPNLAGYHKVFTFEVSIDIPVIYLRKRNDVESGWSSKAITKARNQHGPDAGKGAVRFSK